MGGGMSKVVWVVAQANFFEIFFKVYILHLLPLEFYILPLIYNYIYQTNITKHKKVKRIRVSYTNKINF